MTKTGNKSLRWQHYDAVLFFDIIVRSTYLRPCKGLLLQSKFLDTGRN